MHGIRIQKGIMMLLKIRILNGLKPGPEVIKLFSCSIQLSMKFFQLINIKCQKLAFSYLLAEKISCSAMFNKKDFAFQHENMQF